MLSIAKDVDWLPIVRGRGWAVIMRDKRIRRRPVERQRFLDHGVRAFCLTGAGNQTSWADTAAHRPALGSDRGGKRAARSVHLCRHSHRLVLPANRRVTGMWVERCWSKVRTAA
jgi:hypothetical protein